MYTEALFNVVEEPMLNSLSVVHHLRYKGIASIDTPDQLESDFPQPDSHDYSAQQICYREEARRLHPFGLAHDSLYVSFNLNFGFLGSALFLFLWPMLFRYLRSRSAGTLAATMYVMCSGWLASLVPRSLLDFAGESHRAGFHPDAGADRCLRLVAVGGLPPAGNIGSLFPEPRMETL